MVAVLFEDYGTSEKTDDPLFVGTVVYICLHSKRDQSHSRFIVVWITLDGSASISYNCQKNAAHVNPQKVVDDGVRTLKKVLDDTKLSPFNRGVQIYRARVSSSVLS